MSSASWRTGGAAGVLAVTLVAGTIFVACDPTPDVHAQANAGRTPGQTSVSTSTTTTPEPVGPTGTASTALASLIVKGRAPKSGYTRAQFGPAWADVDHNGCDTRNDILSRDLTDTSWRVGTHDCVVTAGTLADPYTGSVITFTKSSASSVQIDHVVALGDAWQKGAQALDAPTRLLFANDPLNLLAVDGSTNQAKGDGDAATWLPPNKAFRCRYVARQVAVKVRYGLWVTAAERDAIARVLAACPAEPLPDAHATAATPPALVPPPTVPSLPTVPPPPTAPSTLDPSPGGQVGHDAVYYANCAAVRAAGAAPLHVGSPGYRRGLDRDGDGIACE